MNLKKYFQRRLTRLEPPYFITLSFFFIVHLCIVKDYAFDELAGSFFASLGYCHYIVYGAWSPINPVAWSLEVEIQFYLLVPILVKIFAMPVLLRRCVLIGAIGAAPFLQQYTALESLNLNRSIIAYYQYFLVGFLVVDLYLSNIFRSGVSWTIIGIGAVGGVYLLGVSRGNLYDWLSPWLIFLFLLSGFCSPFLRKFLSGRLISGIGGMCYITYLIHYPMMHLLFKTTDGWSPGWGASADYIFIIILWIPIILVVCAFAFLIIEKPFMSHDWPRRLGHRLIRSFTKRAP